MSSKTDLIMTSAGSGEGDDAASVDSRGDPLPERRMGRDEEFEELLARCGNNSQMGFGYVFDLLSIFVELVS